MKHGIVWPGAPPVKAPGLLFFQDFLEGHIIRQRLTAVPVLHSSAWKDASYTATPTFSCALELDAPVVFRPGCNLLYLSNPVQLSVRNIQN